MSPCFWGLGMAVLHASCPPLTCRITSFLAGWAAWLQQPVTEAQMPELPEQTPNIEGQSAVWKVCALRSDSTPHMLHVNVPAWLLCRRKAWHGTPAGMASLLVG